MRTIQYSEILQLSPAERARLAEFIWDSLEEHPETLILTEKQKKELDNRLRYYEQHKEESLPWSVVKEQILTLR